MKKLIFTFILLAFLSSYIYAINYTTKYNTYKYKYEDSRIRTIKYKYPYFTDGSALSNTVNKAIKNRNEIDKEFEDYFFMTDFKVCRADKKIISIFIHVTCRFEAFDEVINYGIINGKITKITSQHFKNLKNLNVKNGYFLVGDKHYYVDNFTIYQDKIQFHNCCDNNHSFCIMFPLSTFYKY